MHLIWQCNFMNFNDIMRWHPASCGPNCFTITMQRSAIAPTSSQLKKSHPVIWWFQKKKQVVFQANFLPIFVPHFHNVGDFFLCFFDSSHFLTNKQQKLSPNTHTNTFSHILGTQNCFFRNLSRCSRPKSHRTTWWSPRPMWCLPSFVVRSLWSSQLFPSCSFWKGEGETSLSIQPSFCWGGKGRSV